MNDDDERASDEWVNGRALPGAEVGILDNVFILVFAFASTTKVDAAALACVEGQAAMEPERVHVAPEASMLVAYIP